jgi:magnesium transporter
MFGKLIQPEIEEMIAARDFAGLRKTFEDWHPADLAELISDISVADQVVVFRLLTREVASETFAYLEHDDQEKLIRAMGRHEVAALLNEMSDDDRTALLEELPGNAASTLINSSLPVNGQLRRGS